MKIGIICAMKIEVEDLKKSITNQKLQTIARIDYISGNINNVEIVAVECGIGKVNAAICTQIMIDNFYPDYIINSGIAGSLTNKVGIADIVIANNVVQHDMNITALGNKMGEIEFNDEKLINISTDKYITEKIVLSAKKLENTNTVVGTIASGDIFVAGKNKREKIVQNFGALACEMEGAAIGQVCYRNDIPFTILRCISDDFEEKYFMEYEKFGKIAAKKSITILRNFIESI